MHSKVSAAAASIRYINSIVYSRGLIRKSICEIFAVWIQLGTNHQKLRWKIIRGAKKILPSKS
jgi:hypothetical protein